MAHITLLEISYCGSYVLSRYKEMPNISNSSADPEGGGQGVRTPLENHKLYGFL